MALRKGETELRDRVSIALAAIIALSDLEHIATLAINTTRKPFFFSLVVGAICIALVAASA